MSDCTHMPDGVIHMSDDLIHMPDDAIQTLFDDIQKKANNLNFIFHDESPQNKCSTRKSYFTRLIQKLG